MKSAYLAPLVTVNADYTDGPNRGFTNIASVLPGSVVTFVQEGKRVNLRERLSSLVGVSQGRTEARAGSALIWDRSRARLLDRGEVLAARPEPGDALLPRWVEWADLELDKVLRITAIAAHRPLRSTGDQPEFDRALGDLVDKARYPVVVGIDTNALRPARLAASWGLEWTGHGIDGFAYAEELVIGRARPLKATFSDHRAVMAPLSVPVPWEAP